MHFDNQLQLHLSTKIITLTHKKIEIKDFLTANANCSSSPGIENAVGIHFNFVLASSTLSVMLLVPGSLLTLMERNELIDF